MTWQVAALITGSGLLFVGGGIWQALRPNFVTRARQGIVSREGLSPAGYTKLSTQISGIAAAGVGLIFVVVGVVHLIEFLVR